MHRPRPRHAAALAALCTPFLATIHAGHSAAQEQLFALDSAGVISRVDGHTTSIGTLAPIATVAVPVGHTVRDLAFDPTTRRFFILATDALGAQLLQVDPAVGTTTMVCAFGGVDVDGLDRRSDGVLVSESGLDELVLIDPATCRVWRVPTSQDLGQHTPSASLTFDVNGRVVSMAPDGTALTIDPLDGMTYAPPFAQAFLAQGLDGAANGDLYIATMAWSIVRRVGGTGQLVQIALTNPPAAATLRGLSLEQPADGAGIEHVCTGAPNSTGQPATLEVVGVPMVGAGQMELRCRDLPAGSQGYFLMGVAAGSTPVASGVLCIASAVLRNSANLLTADAAGTVRLAFSTAKLPVGVALAAGDVYVFQYWHRDVGATANFSTARSVTFR